MSNLPYPPEQGFFLRMPDPESSPSSPSVPYPQTQHLPYPTANRECLPSSQQYPGHQHPYPPQNQSYPQQNMPYPTSANPPYPPVNHSQPSGAPTYLPNQDYSNRPTYPAAAQPVSPYPSNQTIPMSNPMYPVNQPYPAPNQQQSSIPASSYPPQYPNQTSQPYPPPNPVSPTQVYPASYTPSAPLVPNYPPPAQPGHHGPGRFQENQDEVEGKEGLLADMKKLAMKSDLKKEAKQLMKDMFKEIFQPSRRPSKFYKHDPQADDVPDIANAPAPPPGGGRNAETFTLEPKNMKIKRFHGQDYNELKRRARKQGKLFRDDTFDVESIKLTDGADGDNFSIYGHRMRYRRSEIEWKRPKDITSQPKMYVDGTGRFDINQGEIGNCWFLASLANLAESPRCFKRVVPDGQDFEREYAGIFRFRFYRFGEWVEVVIDDRLPTRNGKLIYLKSKNEDEFWSPLLEKAYAKLYGSYKALEGGLTIEASVDFTGGIPEMIDLVGTSRADAKYLFEYMRKADVNGAFMSCSLSNSKYAVEAQNNGLQARHAYTITKVVDVRARGMSECIPLIRMRNPHGNYREWKGDWSDESRQWKMIDRRQREQLDLKIDTDGEFYMNFNIDFLKYFGEVEIVHLTPGDVGDYKGEDKMSRKYNMIHFEGRWSRSSGTAGGCGNDGIDNFAKNPQFIFSITDPKDKPYQQECPVVVSLAQNVEKRKSELAIGFRIYKIQPEMEKADANFLMYNKHIAKTQQYINLREISLRTCLTEGVYVVIPSTFSRGEEGYFLLRLYFDRNWSPSSHQGAARPVDVPDHVPRPRAPSPKQPYVRGFGGRASRVINIPIQILSDAGSDSPQRKQKRKIILEQLMKNKTFRSFAENLEFLYKWRNDPDSEISLLKTILNSLKEIK